MPEAQMWTKLLENTDNPIVFGLMILFLSYVTVSKRLAEVKGPLGALARRWNTRQERRIEREQALWRAKYTADDERKDARVADLMEQVEYLREELRRTRSELAEALAGITRQVGTVSAKLDHPSRLPAPRHAVGEETDTQPMIRV